MRYAYADPPYPGKAKKHYTNDPSGIPPAEVDHAALIARLERDYPDGWALSTNATVLREVLDLCPAKVHVGAWVKTFAIMKPNVNPGFMWEPVIFRGGRKRARSEPTVFDWIACPITTRKGTVGAKPDPVNFWILQMLGVLPDDTLDDLFPGSGGMSRCLKQWQCQLWTA